MNIGTVTVKGTDGASEKVDGVREDTYNDFANNYTGRGIYKFTTTDGTEVIFVKSKIADKPTFKKTGTIAAK
jgi:hypothetical protein